MNKTAGFWDKIAAGYAKQAVPNKALFMVVRKKG